MLNLSGGKARAVHKSMSDWLTGMWLGLAKVVYRGERQRR